MNFSSSIFFFPLLISLFSFISILFKCIIRKISITKIMTIPFLNSPTAFPSFGILIISFPSISSIVSFSSSAILLLSPFVIYVVISSSLDILIILCVITFPFFLNVTISPTFKSLSSILFINRAA